MTQAAQSMMMAAPNRATSTTRIAGGANLQGIDIQLMWPCKDGHASGTLRVGLRGGPFTQNLVDWGFEAGVCDEETRTKDGGEAARLVPDGREPVAESERIQGVWSD